MRPKRSFSTGLRLASMVGIALLAEAVFAAPSTSLDPKVRAYFEQHCLKCHDVEVQKGDFRIDTLSPKVGFENTPQWLEIMERINSGEMPPKKEKSRPTAEQSAQVVEWIAARMKEGEAARLAARARVSYNRLTREEYVNTVRDLIGVHFDATDPGGLLDDPEWHGFERIGSVLTLSATHVEKYITAAEIVLSEAYPAVKPAYTEATKRAETITPEQDAFHYERLSKLGLENKVRFPLWAGDIYRGSNPFNGPKRFSGSGVYEISYTLSGLKAEDKPAPRMQVYAEDLDRVLFEQDIIAPEDKPITVTFRAHFPDNRVPTIHVINKLGGLNQTHRSSRHGRRPFVSLAEGGGPPWQMKLAGEDGKPLHSFMILDSITMRGPIITEQEQKWRDAYMPSESGNMEQARVGLGAMAKRAFRRPLHAGELDGFVRIAENERKAGEKFTDAVKSAMTAILCSKSFLFIAEGDEKVDRHTLNDWEIASRLSYLLWSTMPDEALFALAEQGKLHDKAELEKQFIRMLADPRAARFTDSFPAQWLHLRKVGMFPPDKRLYPNYDSHLEQSMVGETKVFFHEVLHRGLTLREFIESNWTMVNPKLAEFYGIPDITKDEFQRVELKPETHRGGLLTHASVLSLSSDGTRHRPVHRGVWLSEAIFGKSPPPPPANVDPIEPNPVTEPKATLRMKLKAHTHDASCAACHRKIDPLGLAFDNFNAIGQWRTHEIAEGTGDYPPVDASGELPDGRKFKNAAEFKRLLLADLDQFNETFIDKLATYGLRRAMTIDDRAGIKAIAKFSRENDYHVQDIIKAFVLSELFQKR